MRRRLTVALALGAAALVATSCSSGASDTSSGTTATTKAAALVAAKPSSGCRSASPVAPGEEKVTTTSGGMDRWYFRHVPPGYTGSEPMPVVVDLHGYSEGAAVHTKMSALGPYGDTHGFVTITPQGSGDKVALWDTGLDSADVAYIGDLLDEVERTMCVDTRRVYVTGLSNGAFMTSAVACKYGDRIAAVAPVAGIRDIKGCTFARPVPVIAFHGTADGFVDYNGGLGKKVASLPKPDGSGPIGQGAVATPSTRGPSIPEITADWAKRNGCRTTPTEKAVAPDVTLIAFPCPRGAEAELYRVTGGGHAWPGSEFSKAVESVVGPTTFSVDADELMWKFFEAHPLRGT
jgi:polyhydroxybutyrate depolymerase